MSLMSLISSISLISLITPQNIFSQDYKNINKKIRKQLGPNMNLENVYIIYLRLIFLVLKIFKKKIKLK